MERKQKQNLPANGGATCVQSSLTIFERLAHIHDICDSLDYQVKRCKALAEAMDGETAHASISTEPARCPQTDVMSILTDRLIRLETISNELSAVLNRMEAVIPPVPQTHP